MHGIICGLTDKIADFQDTCISFVEDSTISQAVKDERDKAKYLKSSASLGKRFANYFLDLIFIQVFSLAIGLMIGIFLVIFFPSAGDFLSEDVVLLDYLVGFIIVTLYYCLWESTAGKTPAKYITKTKVIDRNGQIPSFGDIFKRTLSRFIPFEPLSFFGSDNTGWHDKLSDTRVVDS